jgi:hypothetical protein
MKKHLLRLFSVDMTFYRDVWQFVRYKKVSNTLVFIPPCTVGTLILLIVIGHVL